MSFRNAWFRPLPVLLVSIGLVLVGASVCFPGICGCASLLGIADPGKWAIPFVVVYVIGMLGILVSALLSIWVLMCWLKMRFLGSSASE